MRDFLHRTTEAARDALSRFCTRKASVMTIPVDNERDADCILSDVISERDSLLLQIDEEGKRIYKLGLLCDKVIGLEHGFCPDIGEPRDNLTRIKITLERFIEKPVEVCQKCGKPGAAWCGEPCLPF